MRRPSLVFPLFLIIAGALWLLKTTDFLPASSTMIAAALAAAGAAVLITDGVNKQSVVAGPLLVYLGSAVYLYHEYIIAAAPLAALGMMVWGSLLLLARSRLIPDKHAPAKLSGTFEHEQ